MDDLAFACSPLVTTLIAIVISTPLISQVQSTRLDKLLLARVIVRRVCTAALAVSLSGRFRLLLLADRHSFVICILLHRLNVVGIHMMASLLIRTCHDLLLIRCLAPTCLCCVDTSRS